MCLVLTMTELRIHSTLDHVNKKVVWDVNGKTSTILSSLLDYGEWEFSSSKVTVQYYDADESIFCTMTYNVNITSVRSANGVILFSNPTYTLEGPAYDTTIAFVEHCKTALPASRVSFRKNYSVITSEIDSEDDLHISSMMQDIF